MISQEDISSLGMPRTKEWILYHKYQIYKLSNDLIFHRGRLDKLKLHLKALKNQRLKIGKVTAFEQTSPPDEIPTTHGLRGPRGTGG